MLYFSVLFLRGNLLLKINDDKRLILSLFSYFFELFASEFTFLKRKSKLLSNPFKVIFELDVYFRSFTINSSLIFVLYFFWNPLELKLKLPFKLGFSL